MSVDAQNQKISSGYGIVPPSADVTITQQITAVEVTDGVLGWDEKGWDTMFGYGFSGQATGDVSGVFGLSMNCFPSYQKPGMETAITGGMWTLPIYAYPPKGFNQVYVGSIFGKIVGGNMNNWTEAGTGVYIELEITGGTLAWDRVTGKGYFKGNLTDTKRGEQLNGELTLTYLPPTR